jgi:membrane protease YdiL (CAAX protease family)
MTATDPNAHHALVDRRARHVLLWADPLILVFARSAFAVAAQGLTAVIYAINGSVSAWKDAEAWLPVYGTLIDAGCLALLWWLTRCEGIRLLDLIGFDRNRLGRDVLLGLALIPACLLFIFGGVAVSSLLVYGHVGSPQFSEPLPFIAALYAVLIWPLIWGFTEQMTYNGYLVPRLQVLSGSTGVAIAIVAFAWSLQHAFMPMTFDPDYMVHRFLSSIPNTIFMIAVYLRMRRLLPLAIAHWLMDGASAAFSF